MNQAHGKFDLDDLVLRKLDGTISRSEYEHLVSTLSGDPEAVDYYIDLTLLYASLSEPGKLFFDSGDDTGERNSYDFLFARLAEEEKNAAALPLVRQTDRPVLVEGVRERKKNLKASRQISRFNLWFAIGSLAAMLTLIVYVIHHPRSMPMDVATLTDALGAQWKHAESRPIGSRFKNTGVPHLLASGLATVTFDYGAEVILEGPSEFSILSAEKIHLHSGRLFARVPGRAVGFIVDMPAGSIIDLGTEFGVAVRPDGTGDVKLFSGSASLLAGEQGIRSSSRILVPGQASRIVGDTGQVIDIMLGPHEFVRRFDSSTGVVWKGQPLDLADIVGGGSGFGTGIIGMAINPVSGKSEMLSVPMPGEIEGSAYARSDWNAYVDGVFVPNAKTGDVAVNSKGHVFAQCPETSGTFWTPVSNGGAIAPNQEIPVVQLILNGKPCGTKENPAIFMHSNLGITFDLDAMRADMPNTAITEFSAICGISENAPPRFPRADFWVLIDGDVRFSRKAVDGSMTYPINIPITARDRFLTLAVTDSGEYTVPETGEVIRAVDCDWGLFANPRLILKAE